MRLFESDPGFYARSIDLAWLSDRIDQWLLACATHAARVRYELEKVRFLTEAGAQCERIMRDETVECIEGRRYRSDESLRYTLDRLALAAQTGRRLLMAQGVAASCWA